jgi:hypothetical protein
MQTMKTRLLALVLALTAVVASADPVKLSGSIRVRGENWAFYDAPGFESDYSYLGTLLRGSAAQQVNKNFDWQFELAATSLLNLPEDAVAPAPRGQLGLGGSYYAANDNKERVAMLFAKQAFVRYKWGANALRVGRFEWSEGSEVTPKNAMLAPVKATRVAQRLIGPFGFSHVGRSFDGVHYAHNTETLNFTAVGFRPTRGAFDVQGNDQLDDVGVVYGSMTFSRPNADERLFVIAYQDERNVVKTDNRPAAVRNLDRDSINVLTLGGHYLAAFGKLDVLLWGAYQTGEWGTQDHSAAAIDVEGGWHFDGAMKPVVRGGLYRSTGDDNAGDAEHGTYFQVLPTPRVYARFPFYNAMNSTDAFVQFSIKPTAKLTLASEAHVLKLTEDADLWYSGGGAFEETSFGFAGRTANGNDDLARTLDLSVEFALSAKTNFTVYVGQADGGGVVDSIFADDTARFVYLEVLRRF